MTEKQKAIHEAQGYLRNISRTFGDIPLLIPDGIFGEETEKTVLAFQKKQGLEQTGIINYETWIEILKENERAAFISSDLLLIANEEFSLRRGMQGRAVAHLNTMLQRLGESYGNFSPVEISDVFDAETERSVKQWQRVIRAEETGEVDKLTWERLTQWYLR